MITSPVFIIGCPRSGTTLLYRLLSEARPLWSIGGESRHIIERFHHPELKGWDSGTLTAGDPTHESRKLIPEIFEREAAPWTLWARVNRLRDWLGRRPAWRGLKRSRGAGGGSGELAGRVPRFGIAVVRWAVRWSNRMRPVGGPPKRLLEKTPENSLRLPFLLEIFPDARVVYLTRDGRANIGSLIDGWRRPDLFRGYRIPERLSVAGIPAGRWAFTLIPGWRRLLESPLEEICARQWISCNEAVLDYRRQAGRDVPFLTLRHEDLIARPREVVQAVAAFADVEVDWRDSSLPEANIVSPPDETKWRRLHGEAIERIEPLIASTRERLGYRD